VLLIWALFMSVFSRRLGSPGDLGPGAAVHAAAPGSGRALGQDDYIGGVLLAVWALGWGYYTPLAAKGSGR
jgi:hypothetical protein